MITRDRVQILETTLRDGSYVIDFQFTQQDTQALTGALSKLGIKLIEVGHGVGINASPSKGRSAATDVEYVRAARAAAGPAWIGMFCIPGIARLDDLKRCMDAGLQFVRIGVNADQVELSKSFVEAARKAGVFVCTNFMKSYALPPKQFADIVRQSDSYGSQMIYLVDSAGGMLPDEVTEYIAAMTRATRSPIGFHGHNNLNLVVANSLAAVKAGASVVDTTLLGMGRSSGNAPTEIMIPLLQRVFGACRDLDPILFLELAESVIAPFLKNRWENTEKTALGLAQVHSMYARKIKSEALSKKLSYFSLISEVGKLDKLNLNPETVAAAVSKALDAGCAHNAFGPLSLIEPLNDDSPAETITRVAIKLNIPIKIYVQNPVSRRVRLHEAEIELCCARAEADGLLSSADTAQKMIVSGA